MFHVKLCRGDHGVAIGALTDRFGRRVTLISCVAGFSVLTLLIAIAPNVEVFIALRFLAGLGLGGCLPIALAFVDMSKIPLPPEAAKTGLDGVKQVDFRWGFQDDALMSILRLAAPDENVKKRTEIEEGIKETIKEN